MRWYGLIGLLVIFTAFQTYGVAAPLATDSLEKVNLNNDTLAVAQKDTAHSVKKATVLSAVLPGAGQIYNHMAMPPGKKKAYWKVPLIYAGLGSMAYFFIVNNREVRDLKAEYISRENGTFLYPKYQQYDQTGVLTLFRQSQNQRDLCILGFGAVYALQVLDAAVEAHFVNFDVSEDLSLHIRPKMYGNAAYGIGFTFAFH